MSNNEQIHEVELSIEQARGAVNTLKTMESLRINKDWKQIIEEDYFTKEASRLVLLKADASCQTEEIQTGIDKQIIAIGYFRQYISTIYQLGRMAEKAVGENEKTLEELNAEDLSK